MSSASVAGASKWEKLFSRELDALFKKITGLPE